LQVYLDLAGGFADDMFIAAVLDAFPELESRVVAAIDGSDGAYPVACSLDSHRDDVLTGQRFEVASFARLFGKIPFAFSSFSHGDSHPHEHMTWDAIRERLNAADIDAAVRAHALAILHLLMESELAKGGETARVEFREAGAWDTIAGLVGAAALIDALGAVRWTASPVPVRAKLVTPTGAAILRYLCPVSVEADQPLRKAGTLLGSGTGFGSRQSASGNAHVSVLCFDDTAQS
jgi:uncharacterized protein (DUF111 family)